MARFVGLDHDHLNGSPRPVVSLSVQVLMMRALSSILRRIPTAVNFPMSSIGIGGLFRVRVLMSRSDDLLNSHYCQINHPV